MSGGMFDADALLLGRHTYESFAASWGSRSNDDDPGTEHMNTVRKCVASRTLQAASWTNSVILQGDTQTEIENLKNEDGGDIAVSGSPTLVRWLIAQGLLDELSLLLYPKVRGTGKQLFTGLDSPHTLALETSATFTNGVLHLVYHPITPTR